MSSSSPCRLSTASRSARVKPARGCAVEGGLAQWNVMPMSAAKHERKRSFHSMAMVGGAKRASQRMTAECGKIGSVVSGLKVCAAEREALSEAGRAERKGGVYV